MPQMAPMLWLLIMKIVVDMLLLMMIYISFYKTFLKSKKLYIMKKKENLWKW